MTEKQQITYKSTREWLIAQIDAWLAADPKRTEKTFGWLAIKDDKLVERLRGGGDVTTRKLDSIIRFLRKPQTKGNENGKEG